MLAAGRERRDCLAPIGAGADVVVFVGVARVAGRRPAASIRFHHGYRRAGSLAGGTLKAPPCCPGYDR
jgi:hypothetical protein